MNQIKINNTNKVVGYCRYSSDNQSEASIEAQQREIKRYAEENDYVIINWYIDRAQSGTSDNRKEFKEMITDSKKRNFSAVLVYQMDRFARNREDHISYKVDLKRNGVKVISVTEKFDNTPEGKLLEAIVEGITAYYSDDLSRKTLKNLKENALNAKNNGGTPPYGYKLIPRLDALGNPMYHKKGHALHDIAIEPERAEAVKIMFDMTLNGNTRGEIIKRLDKLGYKRANGKSFTGTSIDNILRNERYTGTYIYDCNKKNRLNDPRLEKDIVRIENGLPQIVTKEVFDGVQKIIQQRIHRQPSIATTTYLLSGKIFCGECGEPYIGSKIRCGEYLYYKCKNQLSYKDARKQEHYCHNNSVRKEDIEQFVISKIKKVVFNDNLIDDVMEEYVIFAKEMTQNKSLIEMLENQIKDYTNQINNLVKVIANGNTNEVILNELTRLENLKKDTEIKLENERSTTAYQFPTREELKKVYKKAQNTLENGSETEKKTMLQNFINKIYIHKDKVDIYLNLVPTMLAAYLDIEINNKKNPSLYDITHFETEEEDNKKEKAESTLSSQDFANNSFIGENQFGSSGRARTYDLSVNSRVLHHWATEEYVA